MRLLLSEARTPLRKRLQAYALLAAAFTFLPMLATLHYALEITTHFRVQYAVTLLLAALVLAAARMGKTAALVALVAALNAARFAGDYLPRSTPPTRGSELTLMSYNVLGANPDREGVIRSIRDAAPDVLIVLELTAQLDEKLRELLPDLLPVALSTRSDNFGIGLYTRLPVRQGVIKHFGGDPTPSAVATVLLDDAPLTVVGLHPPPPVGDAAVARRDTVLLEAAHYATSIATEAVVAGDFNASPWTPAHAGMLGLGLVDTRPGFGVQASWPSYAWFLRVPIDHVLTTPGLVTLERRLGDAAGSDHRPVVVRLARRAP
jgi:endonuclease/exonuclease/phosphatase (EEP) superfamily protein YafD